MTDEHFASAAKTGDKLGTQTPVLTRTESQKKTRTVQNVRENASFAEIVGLLDNALVAAEGLEQPYQTREKLRRNREPEAKSEAAALDPIQGITVEDLASWLRGQLQSEQMRELAWRLLDIPIPTNAQHEGVRGT